MKYNPQIHHRRSIRLKGYDYSQAGAYFITICTKNRQNLFGHIENGIMILNEMGQIAYNEWLKTPEIRPNVSLDVFVVMPNHMHGIILINDDTRRGELHSPGNVTNVPNIELYSPDNVTNVPNIELHSPGNVTNVPNIELHSPGNVINRGEFRGECNSPDNIANRGEFRGECNSPLRSPSNNVGAIVRGYKSSVTKQINLLNYDVSVWQRNYHEHIIRNEKSYHHIAGYIIDNPKNWNADKFYMK
jgi:REP element-mobilizing transposase RayT